MPIPLGESLQVLRAFYLGEIFCIGKSADLLKIRQRFSLYTYINFFIGLDAPFAEDTSVFTYPLLFEKRRFSILREFLTAPVGVHDGRTSAARCIPLKRTAG